MGINFPNAPVLNDVYPVTPSPGVPQYVWNGYAWVSVSGASAGALPSNINPLMDGIAYPGIDTAYSRDDHVHPTDTSRAPLASPAFTGIPTAPTPTVGDSSTKLATTAFVAASTPTGFLPLTGGTLTGPLTVNGMLSAATPFGGISLRISETTSGYNKYLRTNTAGALEIINNANTAVIATLTDAGALTIGPATINGNLNCNADIYAIRSNGPTGVLYLGNNGGTRYLYYDGGSYNLNGAPLNCTSGTSSFGAVTVNGELVAATGYIRFNSSGSGGYLLWNGGVNYTLGSGGTIWHTGNLNPSSYVSNGRLAYAADAVIPGSLAEPYGGCVITGQGGGVARYRYMQLYTTGWFTLGYA